MSSVYKPKFKTFQFFTVLILISFSLTAGDCEKILENNTTIPDEMIGNWTLQDQTGALQDICSDENVKFQTTGIALLTCPNSTTISRDFKVADNVLTYTQSNISYSIDVLSNDTLSLLGQNVSRNLLYIKNQLAENPVSNFKETDFINSSDIKK